jgi:hypothetical protein
VKLENPGDRIVEARRRTEKDLGAIRRKWERHLAQARRALSKLDGDEFVSGLNSYLLMLSSEKRPGEMLSLLNRASPETFWKVFLTRWAICDRTWEYTTSWISQLERASSKVSAYDYYDDESRAFYENLPDDVLVYRGCSRERVGGIAWTTDESIAGGFARGHRVIVVADPVIVTATIPKKDIFGVFVDRQESEVVCCPRQILKIISA